MEHIRKYFEQDGLAAHLGIELAEVSPGRATATMPVREHHLNSFGTVHGAAIFALADFVFAVASNSHGTIAVALHADICFLKPGGSGTLKAEASEVACSRKVGTYAIRVTNDAGEVVAVFQGMVYRKGDPIPE